MQQASVQHLKKEIYQHTRLYSFRIMCHRIVSISKVKSGELSRCIDCNIYHLIFNNIFFEFDLEQLHQFKNYLSAIETDYWEEKYACSEIRRKIPIPSIQQNLVLLFDRREIRELQILFSRQFPEEMDSLGVDDIDYTFILN